MASSTDAETQILEQIHLQPIGHVENDFDRPAKPEEIRADRSRIILRPELTPGLLGLEPGQQIIVVFVFHLSEGFELHQHPRGDSSRPVQGVFCTPLAPPA